MTLRLSGKCEGRNGTATESYRCEQAVRCIDLGRGYAVSGLVSIIVPCKNAEKWLPETIESCFNQTWSNIEIIIVDNLSTDGSLEIAKNYASNNVKVIQCPRPGASIARNVGLMHSKGEYVQFLDADDILDPNKIHVQMTRLAREPAGVVASGCWAKFRFAQNDAIFREEQVWRDFSPVDFLVTSWLGGGMMAPFVWLTPSKVIDKAGGWDEDLSLNDDGEFFCRAILASNGVAFCEEAKGFYRSTAEPSLSKRRDPRALLSAYLAVERSTQALLKHSTDPMAVKACAYSFQRFVHATYPLAPALTKLAEIKVKEFGEADFRPGGGPAFLKLCRMIGWRLARRFQLFWQRARKRLAR